MAPKDFKVNSEKTPTFESINILTSEEKIHESEKILNPDVFFTPPPHEIAKYALMAVPEPMNILNTQFQIVWANKYRAELHGLPLEELAGKYCYEVFQNKSEICDGCPALETLRTGRPCTKERFAIKPDGTKVWSETHAWPIHNQKGELIYIVEYAKDITNRKNIEEEVIRGRNKLKRIVDEMGDGLVVIDKEHNILMANYALEKIVNIPSKNLIGKKCYDVFKNEFCNTKKCYLKQSLEKNSTLKAEKKLGDVWVQDIIAPYEDSSGNLSGVVKTMRDITTIKQSEEKIVRLNSILRAIKDIDKLITKESNESVILIKSCQILREVRDYIKVEILSYNGKKLKIMAEDGLDLLTEEKELFKCSQKALNRKRSIIFGKNISQFGSCSGVSNRDFNYSAAFVPFKIQNEDMLLKVLANINQFDDEEVELLEGVVEDISFAIEKLRSEIEQVKAKKTLEETKEKLKRILDSSPDAIIVTDLSNHIIECNPATLTMYGYSTKEELISKNLLNFISPENRKKAEKDIKEIKKHGFKKNLEYNMQKKDGTKFPVEVSSSIIKDSHNKPISFVTIVKDISERKNAERILNESEEKHRLVVENTNEGILVAQDGVIQFVNPTMLTMSGYSREEVILKPFTDFIHPEDRKLVMDRYLMRLHGNTPPNVYTFRIVTKKGEIRIIEINAVLINWEGRPATLNFLRDITEKGLAELALKESEQRYRTTFEHTGTAMAIIEENTTISLVNTKFENLSGYTKEEIIGMKWTDFIHPDDHIKIKETLNTRGGKRDPTESFEFRFVNRKGEIKNILLTIDVIPGTRSSVASHLDITHLKRLNNLLKVLSEINELVSREKSPEVVLKAVCEKLVLVYDAVFTALGEIKLRPIMSKGIDINSIERAIKRCPSISKAIEGHLMKLKMDDKFCRHCTETPHKYVLSIPLIHNIKHGIITIHSSTDFTDKELIILQKISSNIAFALTAYKVERDRKLAMDQLAANLMQFSHLADRLRNPLAIIMGLVELEEEVGKDRVLKVIYENANRIKDELDKMRKEERKTYELTRNYNQTIL